MGLFSGVIRAVSPVGNLILGSAASKKAIGKENQALQLGITNAKGDLSSQLGLSTQNFLPYMSAGTDALGQQRDILGLNGGGAQAGVLASLQSSPLFQSLFRTGHDTLLNDASATGGLRGGNLQSGLANFSADTLTKVIQQQLGNLSPLTQLGFGATDTLARLGAANATQLSGLDVDSGRANAGMIAGKNTVSNNMFDQFQKLFGSAATGGAGGGGIGSILSMIGGGGGGGSIFSGAGSGYGAGGGALPNFPNISSSLPSISGSGLPF